MLVERFKNVFDFKNENKTRSAASPAYEPRAQLFHIYSFFMF